MAVFQGPNSSNYKASMIQALTPDHLSLVGFEHETIFPRPWTYVSPLPQQVANDQLMVKHLEEYSQ